MHFKFRRIGSKNSAKESLLYKNLLRVTLIFLLFCTETKGQLLIVNKANSVSKTSRSFIRNIFLGNTVTWQSNIKVQIVDYPSELLLRRAFSEDYLSLTPMKVTMIWIKVSLSGKSAPPKILRTEEDVKRFIADNEGAIGYVSNAKELPPNVKIIEVE